MRPVTREQVSTAARKGVTAAIKCSSHKWWWYGTCSQDELVKLCHSTYDDECIDEQECALCELFLREPGSCPRCPLEKHWCLKKDSVYAQAADLLLSAHSSKAAFKRFQAKAREFARIIEKLGGE